MCALQDTTETQLEALNMIVSSVPVHCALPKTSSSLNLLRFNFPFAEEILKCAKKLSAKHCLVPQHLSFPRHSVTYAFLFLFSSFSPTCRSTGGGDYICTGCRPGYAGVKCEKYTAFFSFYSNI